MSHDESKQKPSELLTIIPGKQWTLWLPKKNNQGDKMNALMTLANGFLMGSGFILAAIVFKLLFHVGFCG